MLRQMLRLKTITGDQCLCEHVTPSSIGAGPGSLLPASLRSDRKYEGLQQEKFPARRRSTSCAGKQATARSSTSPPLTVAAIRAVRGGGRRSVLFEGKQLGVREEVLEGLSADLAGGIERDELVRHGERHTRAGALRGVEGCSRSRTRPSPHDSCGPSTKPARASPSSPTSTISSRPRCTPPCDGPEPGCGQPVAVDRHLHHATAAADCTARCRHSSRPCKPAATRTGPHRIDL